MDSNVVRTARDPLHPGREHLHSGQARTLLQQGSYALPGHSYELRRYAPDILAALARPHFELRAVHRGLPTGALLRSSLLAPLEMVRSLPEVATPTPPPSPAPPTIRLQNNAIEPARPSGEPIRTTSIRRSPLDRVRALFGLD